MFTIIGGDGKEYGPATSEQIRAWMAAGRANLDTLAKAAGSDGWRRLGDFPEFAAAAAPPIVGAAADSDSDSDSDPELADRLTRLGAWFLDNVLAFLCCLPGMLIVGFSVISTLLLGRGDVAEVMSARFLLGWMLLAIGGLVLLVVQVWMLSTRGQTVGKRLLGIRIVRFEDRSTPGFMHAFLLRAVVPGLIGMIPYLGFIFSIVDICFIFRADRRCIHDFIAGTKVVKA